MITGAMGGPCSGHLLVSHMPLMVESPVGQLNSLALISQTGAKCPGHEDVFKKNASVQDEKIGNSIFPKLRSLCDQPIFVPELGSFIQWPPAVFGRFPKRVLAQNLRIVFLLIDHINHMEKGSTWRTRIIRRIAPSG